MAVISEQEVKFVLNGVTRGLDTMAKEIKKISKATAALENKMGALSNRMLKQTSQMKKHTEVTTGGWARIAKATLVAAAAYETLRIAGNLASESAKFEQQEVAFRKLAASYGTDAGSLIADLKQVSAQTLSTKDVMTSAGKAMLLGIPVEKLSTMMEIARSSSRITGQTVQQAFEDISIGLGRQSKMILDNLGIVFKTNEAYDEYAKTLKKTANQLTDAEKKQAFMNAALKAGENIVKRVGAENVTLAEKQAKAIAALSDLRIQFGKLATEIMSNVLPSLESFTNVIEGISVLIKDMLGDLEKNGDKAHDMGVAYQNARIQAEKLGKQIKRLKEEQGFTEKDAQIKVLRQQQMVWLKLQSELMKDVQKQIKKTKEAEAERAAQKQGGGNAISPENLSALEAYKQKTATVNQELAAATFKRIQKEVLAEAKGLALKEATYLAHLERIKTFADTNAAGKIAKAQQTAAGLLEIASGNSEMEDAVKVGLNARLEQIDIERLTFIKNNMDEILAAQQTSQDAHIASYKAHLKELEKADQNSHVTEYKKLLRYKEQVIKDAELRYKKLSLGAYLYQKNLLLKQYKELKKFGWDKLKLDKWYFLELKKLREENKKDAKKLTKEEILMMENKTQLMQQAAQGITGVIKSLWDESYRGSGGIEDIFKNSANIFIDNLIKMEVQAHVVSIKIQASMAAATAGLSVVLGLVGMFVGSLFGGSGDRIKPLAERLKEVFDDFVDKFGNTIEDFRLSLMTKEQRIAEFNSQNVDITEEIKQSFERLKFVTGLHGDPQARLSSYVNGIKWQGGRIPDTLIEKKQNTERTIGDVLEQERQYIADRVLKIKSIIENRYRDEAKLIKEMGDNIENLINRQKEWGKSLEADITKIQRDGLDPARMLELAQGDVNALETRLKEIRAGDSEGRIAVLKDLKDAYNELYQAGKNALIDSGGHKTVEFEVLKAEVIGGLQRIKEEGTSEFEQMINVQRDQLEAMTGTRDATVALNTLAARQLLALNNLFELGTGATTEISPYILDSFPELNLPSTGPILIPPKSGGGLVPPKLVPPKSWKVGVEETVTAPVGITLNFDGETFVKLIIPDLKEASRTGALTFDVGAVVDEGVI